MQNRLRLLEGENFLIPQFQSVLNMRRIGLGLLQSATYLQLQLSQAIAKDECED